MKKLYFSILALALGMTAANAQTYLLSSSAPMIGDVMKLHQWDTSSFNPGPAGSNVTWNFGTLSIPTSTNTSISNTVAAVSSTDAASFPSASIAITPDGTNKTYYTASPANYKYWGGNTIVQSYNVLLNYTQPAILATYPLAYTNSLSTNVSGSMSMTSPLTASGNFNGVVSYTADATGILQLPGPKTFSNVLRVNTVQALTFTVTSPLTVNGTITLVSYDYYAPLSSPRAPILSITQSTIHATIGTDQFETTIKVNADYPSMGVNELSKTVSGLSIYPNPSPAGVTLSYTNENAEPAWCEISNMLGQTLRRTDLGSEKGMVKHYLNTEGLGSGTYFVKVRVGDKTSVEKITVQ
ncbi:MAG: T9SS type A sorting domain-containing protein [Bacteroidia bacterium]